MFLWDEVQYVSGHLLLDQKVKCKAEDKNHFNVDLCVCDWIGPGTESERWEIGSWLTDKLIRGNTLPVSAQQKLEIERTAQHLFKFRLSNAVNTRETLPF